MDANLIPSQAPRPQVRRGGTCRIQASLRRPVPAVFRKTASASGGKKLRADVAARRHAGAAAQHVLIAHEFAVVFSHRAAVRAEAGIGPRRRCWSTPGVAVELAGPDQPGRAGAGRVSRWPLSSMLACTPGCRQAGGARRIPIRTRAATGPGPTGVGVGLEVAHVRDGRLQLQFLHAVQCEDLPVVALALPERRAPASAQTRSHPCDSHSSGRE